MSVRSARRVRTNAVQIAVALAPIRPEPVSPLVCGCGADAELTAPGTGAVCGGCFDVAVRVAPELVGPSMPLFA